MTKVLRCLPLQANFADTTEFTERGKANADQGSHHIGHGGKPCSCGHRQGDRMKTRQGESVLLKVNVGCETVRVLGRGE